MMRLRSRLILHANVEDGRCSDVGLDFEGMKKFADRNRRWQSS
jgi:hypothetical protein